MHAPLTHTLIRNTHKPHTHTHTSCALSSMKRGSATSLFASKVANILAQTLWNANCTFLLMIRSLLFESVVELKWGSEGREGQRVIKRCVNTRDLLWYRQRFQLRVALLYPLFSTVFIDQV
jgi:hypothetical protein